MNIVSLIMIDVIAIIMLILSISLVQKNEIRDQSNKILYIVASFCTILIILMEIVSEFLMRSENPQWVLLHKFVNVIGFGLSPLVPYLMLLFQSKKYKRKILTMIPLLFHFVFVISSFFTGQLFEVNEQNHYQRGEFFLLSAMICMFYYILIVLEIVYSYRKRDQREQVVIWTILLLPTIGTIVQIIFPDILLIWSSVAVTLVFYYRVMREFEFKFDPLTRLLTRTMLDVETELYNRGSKDLSIVTIIVFDLNDFKKINDDYGHGIGDKAIQISAQLVAKSFVEIGKCYRFGGDEFVVICENTLEQTILRILNELDNKANSVYIKNKKLISYSYGFTSYNAKVHKRFEDVLHAADERMYFHKSKNKARKFLTLMK